MNDLHFGERTVPRGAEIGPSERIALSVSFLIVANAANSVILGTDSVSLSGNRLSSVLP